MDKLYLTDNARQSAIDDIWESIHAIMNTPVDALGGYVRAHAIVQSLAKLQDVIYAEAEDKNAVKRYKD